MKEILEPRKTPVALFDGTADSFRRWRQIGPGNFALSDSAIVASGTTDFGLLYYPHARFADFTLRAEFSLQDPEEDNSGVFVRFRDPLLPLTAEIHARDRFNDIANNPAWIAAHSGFEIQIGELAGGNENLGQPDGLGKHQTGAELVSRV